MNVAKVDAIENRDLLTKFGIPGFPYLLLFTEGADRASAIYEGHRGAVEMKKWLNDRGVLKPKNVKLN